MKIIEIRQTRNGEVAYILDEERRSVIKVFVDDYTNPNKPAYEEPEAEMEMPRRRVKVRPVEMPTRGGEAEIYEDEIFPEKEKPNTRRQAPPSIIPSNLAGVFRKPGSPGEAIESRNI